MGQKDHDLSEEEREKFQEFQKSEFNSNEKIDLEVVLDFISSASDSEIVKIKNQIAIKEDGFEPEKPEISEEEVEEVFNENTEEVQSETEVEEKSQNKEDLGKENSQRDEILEVKEETDETKESFEKEELILEDDNSEQITSDEIELSEEVNSEFDESFKETENKTEEFEMSEELEIVDDSEDEYQIEDVEVSNVSSKSIDSDDEPILFSVVHDELMELFNDGKIALLKEKFDFPSLGERETLAFGIYNADFSQTKEQTHWFVQHLKQFSRLKECKMLLSEEGEKDLILEVGDTHAILLSFKTTNLINEEFTFNREWN